MRAAGDPALLQEIVRARVARLATGASAVRSYPKGTGKTARLYFQNTLPLEKFATSDESTFRAELDRQTIALMRRLPKHADNRNLWGISRKLLNIFLRDCHYSHDIRAFYRLGGIGTFLEVPLDRVCAERIREWCVANGRGFGPVFSICGLDPKRSTVLQSFCTDIAAQHRLARVHLDSLWWAKERN